MRLYTTFTTKKLTRNSNCDKDNLKHTLTHLTFDTFLSFIRKTELTIEYKENFHNYLHLLTSKVEETNDCNPNFFI